MSENTLMDWPLPSDDAVICAFCGNVYKIEWLKEGNDYNDFGQRYCHFCGLMTDQWLPLKRKRLTQS